MADWDYEEYLPPDVRPRMDGHRRSHWNHMANPYTFYKTPYSNYDSRVYTWAGPINPDLYSKKLNVLTHQTEADLCRLSLQIANNNKPCYDYGIKHWHPNSKGDQEHEQQMKPKEKPQPRWNYAWENRDVVFADRECLDRPYERSTSAPPVTKKVQNHEEDSLAGPFNAYCYLCTTQEEHKRHHFKRMKKKTRAKPRVMYIAPPPTTVRKKKVEEKPSEKQEIAYRAVVTTGSDTNAGTDANVYIHIKGSKGVLKKTQLTKNRVGFRFCRKVAEVFYIRGPDLGEMQYLIIEHDGVEKEQGWFLEKVQVTNMKTRQTFLFKCRQWLSLHEGDQLLKRKLSAEEKGDEMKDYKVLVQTGSKKWAGTDSNVTVTLYGRKGVSPKLKLQDKTKNLFEKGQIDVFNLNIKDIGPLTKIRIAHDGSGMSDGWYLEQVIITDREDKTKQYLFPCHDWLARDEGNGELWRDIMARKNTQDEEKEESLKSSTLPYEIDVCTGNKWGSGTNANVFMQIFGKIGKTKKLDLAPEDCLNHKDPFENGQVDNFQFDLKDVGRITKITVGHDDSGIGAGWFLDRVIIRRFLTSAEMKAWFDKERSSKSDERNKELVKGKGRGKQRRNQKKKASDSDESSSEEGEDVKKKKKKRHVSKDSDNDSSSNDGKKNKKTKKTSKKSDSDSSSDEEKKKDKKEEKGVIRLVSIK